MPKAKATTSSSYTEADDDDADDVEIDKKNTTSIRVREGLSLESLSVFHDHYNYTDISNCASSFLSNVPDIPPNIDVNVDLATDGTFSDDSVNVNRFHICRLCAETFPSSENIVEISTDVYDQLNDLISGTVSRIFDKTKRLFLFFLNKCSIHLNFIEFASFTDA